MSLSRFLLGFLDDLFQKAGHHLLVIAVIRFVLSGNLMDFEIPYVSPAHRRVGLKKLRAGKNGNLAGIRSAFITPDSQSIILGCPVELLRRAIS